MQKCSVYKAEAAAVREFVSYSVETVKTTFKNRPETDRFYLCGGCKEAVYEFMAEMSKEEGG